tara:strand:- start:1123 stop:2697 length:1575 start_codon:yes stop_codon:yes gene_type:complete
MANEFDFSSLGSMFGGGGMPTGLDALLTEDQRKLLGRNAALSAAGALLQASGRSAVPISMGQALGSALQAGQAGYQQARASSLQDLMLGQKLQEAKTAQDLQKQIAGILTGAPTGLSAEQQALAAPGMPVGPTVARADLAANIPQPSANEIKAGQYQKIADLMAAAGKGEDAKRYQDIAKELNPRAEVVGQPFEVTDPNGKAIMVQQYKTGEIKTLQGYGPKRDVVLQNLGGQTVAIDKSKLTGTEAFAQTMTPSEIANLQVARGNLAVAQGGLNLRQQEFNRGGYQIKETPEGLAYVPTSPGGPAMPVMTAAGTPLEGVGAKPTEDQSKSAGFAFRMKQSSQIFNQPALDKSGQPIINPDTNKPVTLEDLYGKPTRWQAALREIPSAGATTGIANVVEDVGRQQYRQAQENWVTANLRPESGAAIGVDEMAKEIQKYFPQANDKPETIAQKARARRDTELAMIVRAGPAYKQMEKAVAAQNLTNAAPAVAAQPSAAVPTVRQPTGVGRLVKDPVTGVYRYVME